MPELTEEVFEAVLRLRWPLGGLVPGKIPHDKAQGTNPPMEFQSRIVLQARTQECWNPCRIGHSGKARQFHQHHGCNFPNRENNKIWFYVQYHFRPKPVTLGEKLGNGFSIFDALGDL